MIRRREDEDGVNQQSLPEGKPAGSGHFHILIGTPEGHGNHDADKKEDRSLEEQKKPAESKKNSWNNAFHRLLFLELCTCPPESSFSLLKIENRLQKDLFAKVRPHDIGEINLGIGELPEQEI